MGEHVVPDEAAWRVSNGVYIRVLHTVRITARETSERFLHIIGRDAGVRPLMAVRAENDGAIGVIEQHELAHHFVLVRRDAFLEDAERRIAVTFLDVAEDLIVSTVFLDDIDNVLEHAWLIGALWHGTRRFIWPGGQARCLDGAVAHVA